MLSGIARTGRLGGGVRVLWVGRLVLSAGLASFFLLAAAHCPAASAKWPLSWKPPVRADASPPFASTAIVSDASCPSLSFCALVDSSGALLTSTDPGSGPGAWDITQLPAEGGLTSVSCPSSTFCVAGDSLAGNLFVSSDPLGGIATWSQIKPDPEASIESISCPSANLCVAGDWNGNLLVSTSPSNGSASWKVVPIPLSPKRAVSDVSCPVTNLCVAVAENHLITSTAPANPSAWSVSTIPGFSGRIEAVSCVSIGLCVAADDDGHVLSSTDPAGGGATWSIADLGIPRARSVSCPSEAFCAIAAGDSLVTSSDPTGGAGAWHAAGPADPHGLLGTVSCASSSFCLLGENFSAIFTSTEPAGGAADWSRAALEIGSNAMTDLSCASRALCVGVDNAGNVVSTTDPIGSTSPWNSAHVDEHRLNGVSCPSSNRCIAVDQGGNVLVSSNPSGAASAWATFNVDSAPIEAVECPSEELCLAIDRAGNLLGSSEPTAESAWSLFPFGEPNSLDDISCASPQLCVTIWEGQAFFATAPLGGLGQWQIAHASNNSLESVSCTAPESCVGVGFKRAAAVTSEAANREVNWLSSTVDSLNGFEAVGCAAAWVCVATTYGGDGTRGNVLVLSQPPLGSWTQDNAYGNPVVRPDPMLDLYEPELSGVSCTSDRMCAVADLSGHVMIAVPATPSPPSNLASPRIVGVTTAGNLLTCQPGIWIGEPEPSLVTQWLLDGAAIPGATGATYAIGNGDEGHQLACRVTAMNLVGSASVESSAVGVSQREPKPPVPPPSFSSETTILPSSPPGDSVVDPNDDHQLRIVSAKVHKRQIDVSVAVPGAGRLSAVATLMTVRPRQRAQNASVCALSPPEAGRSARLYGRAAATPTASVETQLQIKPRRPILAELRNGPACIWVVVTFNRAGSAIVSRASATRVWRPFPALLPERPPRRHFSASP